MATITRQTTVWQHLEKELPPGLEEVRDFLSVLSEFDGPLVHDMSERRGCGRDDHPVAAMWNLFAVQLYLRRGRFSELLAELARNSDLARLLGFTETGPNQYDLPSSSALSRVHRKLNSPEFVNSVVQVFDRTVATIAEEFPHLGRNLALDASDVRTHARPAREARASESGAHDQGASEQTTPPSDKTAPAQQITVDTSLEPATDDAKPSSDPEASWSIKSKTRKSADGQSRKTVKKTFGYKLYAVTDTSSPVVWAVDVTTGSQSDFSMAMTMLDRAAEVLSTERIETLAMDKGFDSEENIREAFKRGVAAIVPVRDVPGNLERLPAEDREEPLVPGGNLFYDRYSGQVVCYDRSSKEAVRREMKHAGFESERQSHKFRCPLAAASTSCGSFENCSAGSAGRLGRQTRVSLDTDYRRFAPVYPRSQRWQRLYNGRSAVERINGYLKDVLPLERHSLRGQRAIQFRVLLASLTLNLRTLMKLRAEAASARIAA